MAPLVCLLTGGRSLRMGRDKAGLYRGSSSQAQWLARLVIEVVGPRVIEVGGTAANCDYFLDRGMGPACALHEAAIAGAFGEFGVVVVLPVDLYRLEATGVRWFVREVLRMPSVLMLDHSPSWATFGAPVEMLRQEPIGGSMRAYTSRLRLLEVPSGLASQFYDSDYPWELPDSVGQS
ncbi:NTP transferase domain-containing protein [Ferrimicrobium acidiphilum]|nr:NTP transferase domain-containing protein [Ferrimicrobium acidiphilum]MCL5054168.1 NTP transferase domain-containing protein [Gammaproteobacteria bacterium]